MITWREAWHHALYGDAGFYRQPAGPAGHFATSTHPPLGAVFAEAIAALAAREGMTRIVDMGCGRGELLRALHCLRPDLGLLGVDVVPRPEGLPDAIEWLQSPGGATLPPDLVDLTDTLVIANEWLDVVPCTIAEVDAHGVPREVLVDPVSGEERLGPALTSTDVSWCERHWPTAELTAGDRLEVGVTRDAAYAELAGRIRSGMLVAIDYGHLADCRPTDGTLIGYASGMTIDPAPDGLTDLTAHVAMDSLPGAELRTQREWLLDLLPRPQGTDLVRAQTDPAGYLAAVAKRSALMQLTDSRGLGGFFWAVTHSPERDGTRPAEGEARHTADSSL